MPGVFLPIPLAPTEQAAVLGAELGPSFATDGQPPRPGCGYGDDNHDHQARRPGQDSSESAAREKGLGDKNHPHTAPPGQAPDDGGAGTPASAAVCKEEPALGQLDTRN